MAVAQPLLAMNFLSDAAHLLREVAPETSAHLMSQCSDHLGHQGSTTSDIYRQHVCGACGYIMVPGDETKIKLEARQVSHKRKRTSANKSISSAATGPSKTITCGHCKSITRIQLPAPEKTTRSKATKNIATSEMKDAPEKTKPTANSSSKKRAKNRKVGLQALLSSQQKPSGGLSLASFMK